MSLRTEVVDLLFRPRRFFERGGSRPLQSLVVVAVVTIIAFAFGWAFFELLVARIDGTVMAENPAYPGDAFCQINPAAEGCDAPREVRRDIDTVIADVRGEVLVLFLFFPPLGWLFSGLFLHVGSWLAGDEGTAKDSFAIAAWGVAPVVFSLVVGMAVLRVTFDPVTVTAGTNADQFLDLVTEELDPFVSAATVFGIGSTLWGAYINHGGLVATRGVRSPRAAVIVGVLAALNVVAILA
jgi:hypothetical protein